MPRILVADDRVDQLELQKVVLEAKGYDVSVAFCPSEAVRQLGRCSPDLVIMDLKFPNAEGAQDAAEGLALIRYIREQGCRAPVIVLSGWPESIYGTPEEAMVSRVLVKPVAMNALLEAVGQLLRAAQAS